MDETIIKVDHVSKLFKLPHEKHTSIKSIVIHLFRKNKGGYELQKALNNVSFEVKRGEFIGIVGRNGSGKSTLLKMLAGIYPPTKGSIHVAGKLTPFIELGVGFNPELTGRENVYLNGALLGFNRKEMTAMYQQIVDFAEIEKFMDQKLKNYSSGMQVRLAFSIAIRAKSDILLLDEVLAVGDAAFQQKCFNYFEDLKLEKQTVVFVSHDMGAIRRFCNRAIYMRNGDLTYDGSALKVADMYIADNIESDRDRDIKIDVKSSTSKIRAKISSQVKDKLILQVEYSTKDKDDMYVAISILRDGISFAEIRTPSAMKLNGRGKLSYTLDTTPLNGGIYQITLVLCRQKNRELVQICEDRPQFMIEGNDITKGAALKLDDTWKQI